MTMNKLKKELWHLYEALDGSDVAERYAERHGIKSASILTVYNDETADLIARYLAPRIEGKTVVEIGGGIGLLAFHMATYAKRVYCIEADPGWATSFVAALYAHKPVNVSYLFGTAQEFMGQIRGDVALFCTHSDAEGMKSLGLAFAPESIDVYGEIVASSPKLVQFQPLRKWPAMRAVMGGVRKARRGDPPSEHPARFGGHGKQSEPLSVVCGQAIVIAVPPRT